MAMDHVVETVFILKEQKTSRAFSHHSLPCFLGKDTVYCFIWSDWLVQPQDHPVSAPSTGDTDSTPMLALPCLPPHTVFVLFCFVLFVLFCV